MAAKFVLNGKKIEFDWNTEEYTKFRKRFYKVGADKLTEFENYVDDTGVSGDSSSRIVGKLIEGAKEIYESFEDMFVSKGCYNFSPEMMTKDSMFTRLLSSVDSTVKELKSNIAAAEAYGQNERDRREYRKETRGRVIGGGFGVGGYIKGAMTAGAINGVTGLAHGIFNAVGNMGTSMEVDGMKDNAYANFKSAIKKCANKVYTGTHGILVKQLGIDYEVDIDNAEVVYQNVVSGKIKGEYVADAMMAAIRDNPYEVKYYETYLNSVPSDETVIFQMIEYFGVNGDGLRNRIHTFNGVYFNSASDKKAVEGMTEEILTKVGLDGELSSKSWGRYYAEDYWQTHWDDVLIDKFISEISDSLQRELPPQVNEYFDQKLNMFKKEKVFIVGKLQERADVYGEEYFHDIVKAMITILPKSDDAYRLVKLPEIQSNTYYSTLDNAYRGYIRSFGIDRKDVFLIFDESKGFAITKDGVVCSTGAYISYDDLQELMIDKENVLYAKKLEGEWIKFIPVGGEDSCTYLTGLFSYLFHPELIPDDFLAELKNQLARQK